MLIPQLTHRSRAAFCRDRCFFALLALIVFSISGVAQMETARVSGQITDPAGRIVSAADVSIANLDTGVASQTATNDEGIYSFASLIPGRYRVTVHAPGFKVAVVDGLVLNVQAVVAQNVQLEIGSVAESVTISADAVTIDTSDATVSTVIDDNLVQNLPLRRIGLLH